MTSSSPRLFDVVVLGAGTAGLAAYRAAAAHTSKLLLVEGGAYGTTCARVGCMPSKLLIAAGDAAHHARHAGPFGVQIPEVRVDGKAVMERVRKERDRFVGFVVDSVNQIPAEHHLPGYARFLGPDAIEVAGERIQARAVVIATGSSPFVPESFRGLGDRMVVNDHVFDWTDLPQSVAVFGAGIIGLELGQALHRLGVRVRIFGRRGGVGALTDPAVKASMEKALRDELSLLTDARVHGVSREGDEVVVDFDDERGERRVERFARALIAAGRRANTGKLGLASTGIELDEDGVPLFDRGTLRCGESSIFLAGDVSNDIPLLHEAADEGRIAGENAGRFPDVSCFARRTPLSITFTEPEMATVGRSFASLAGDADVVVGEVSFENQGRSRVMLQNRGLLHVYASRSTGRFLGAEMAGPRAEHLGHLLAWSHQAGLTIEQMLAMPFYHPVVEEGLRTALRDVATKITPSEKNHAQAKEKL